MPPHADSDKSSSIDPAPASSDMAKIAPELKMLLQELRQAFTEDSSRTVSEFIARRPDVTGDSMTAVELIYEDYCLRRDAGIAEASDAIVRRFPQWRSQLEVVFHCDQLISTTPSGIELPEPGDAFGDFQLHQVLGRGISGRVYLATQPSLSDRPVVLKLSESEGDEHRSLARLQHSAIVPLLFIQEDEQKKIRTLCMPYLGGCTLDKAMREMRGKEVTVRRGKDFSHAIQLHDVRLADPTDAALADPPAVQFLKSANYEQAVCWIIACLADGLHYAHQRGLLHLDVKPSNVLLANDGQPMLLDFHLARERSELAGQPITSLGGTPGYMAPEHYEAIKTIRQGDSSGSQIDERSDIYSLGLILQDLLSGALPPSVDTREESPIRAPRSPSPASSTTSSQAAAVLNRCLIDAPDLRYTNAAEFAADLRLIALNHRTDPNGAPAHKDLSTGSTKILNDLTSANLFGQNFFFGMAIGVVLATVASLGIRSLDSSPKPTSQPLPSSSESITQSQRSLAIELHSLVSQARTNDLINTPDPEQLQKLELLCEQLWEKRSSLLAILNQRNGLVGSQRLENDLQDLSTLLCELKTRSASKAQLPQVLEEIEQIRAEARQFKRAIDE